MIISQNRDPSLGEFESLISKATALLNDDAQKRTDYYLGRNAQLLEKDVYQTLSSCAEGTKFEKTIKIISGQRFPDIVAAKYYGVEVKSSKDDKWTSLGGSVNESTRVEDVERIYLTYGKLIAPIEFRSRPYEECLSEVVATHYPRYKIDMKLGEGETIFDKMGMTYDELRQTGDTVGEIIKYYKRGLKKGESLWWIENSTAESNATASMKVRLWSSLTKTEQLTYRNSLFALFPNILSTMNNKKYSEAVLWLASRHGIVDSSFRDNFSAGGTVTIITSRGIFEKLPKVFEHIQEFATDIRLLISSTESETLCETWQVDSIDDNRLFQWINLVAEKHKADNYNCGEVLRAIFDLR